MDHHENHDGANTFDRGLAFDLATLMERRRALRIFTGAAVGGAALALVGCGDDGSPAATGTAAGVEPERTATGATNAAGATRASGGGATTAVRPIPTQATPASSCSGVIPSETGGPFPGDGSNGPNVLTALGIVRSDIRSSFGTSRTVAQGVPLAIRLTIVDTKNGCAPMPGASVYIWHCDAAGDYSMYSQAVTNENYLRGVQMADSAGVVTFQTVFPGCYAGRWPHAHFEVFASMDVASSSRNARITSQLALPEDACKAAYSTAGYTRSSRNLSQISLATDGVFRDGWGLQMAAMSGDARSGYTAALTVGV